MLKKMKVEEEIPSPSFPPSQPCSKPSLSQVHSTLASWRTTKTKKKRREEEEVKKSGRDEEEKKRREEKREPWEREKREGVEERGREGSKWGFLNVSQRLIDQRKWSKGQKWANKAKNNTSLTPTGSPVDSTGLPFILQWNSSFSVNVPDYRNSQR